MICCFKKVAAALGVKYAKDELSLAKNLNHKRILWELFVERTRPILDSFASSYDVLGGRGCYVEESGEMYAMPFGVKYKNIGYLSLRFGHVGTGVMMIEQSPGGDGRVDANRFSSELEKGSWLQFSQINDGRVFVLINGFSRSFLDSDKNGKEGGVFILKVYDSPADLGESDVIWCLRKFLCYSKYTSLATGFTFFGFFMLILIKCEYQIKDLFFNNERQQELANWATIVGFVVAFIAFVVSVASLIVAIKSMK